MRVCSIEGCFAKLFCKGMCSTHYHRDYRTARKGQALSLQQSKHRKQKAMASSKTLRGIWRSLKAIAQVPATSVCPSSLAGARPVQSGIYQIRHVMNRGTYIGSSKSIHNRWMRHRALLRRRKHHSRKLQRAWDKYGEKCFLFEVVEEVRDVSELLVREQHYIDAFQPRYNVNPKASTCEARPVSEETRRKLSVALSGRYVGIETRRRQSEAHRARCAKTPEQVFCEALAARNQEAERLAKEEERKRSRLKRFSAQARDRLMIRWDHYLGNTRRPKHSESQKANIAKSLRGKQWSESQRKIISEQWTPERREMARHLALARWHQMSEQNKVANAERARQNAAKQWTPEAKRKAKQRWTPEKRHEARLKALATATPGAARKQISGQLSLW